MALNPLCVEFVPKFMNHNEVPLTKDGPKVRPPPLTPTERKARRVRGLTELESDQGGIAASVKVRKDGKPHQFLTAVTKVSRPERVSITCWQLGMVAAHQECELCHTELSREHAIACSGVMGDMEFAQHGGGSAPSRENGQDGGG